MAFTIQLLLPACYHRTLSGSKQIWDDHSREKPQTELEKLQYENEFLRTELALLKNSESLSQAKTSPTTKFWVEAIEGLRLKGFTLELLLKCEEMARTTFYYHRFRMGIESKDVGLRYLTNISHS